MSRRDLSQPSAMVSGYGKSGGFLDRIEEAFDWSAFEALLSPIHASTRGAPGYPPLVMFKILLVQQWHTLSDPGAEEAVRDRLSFRRFCGLPLEMETPDHASIWRFRQTIDKLGLSAALLAEANRQLDALGLIVKRGTLVDATLIAASVKRPPYGGGGVNPRDPDARVTIKRKKTYFGYKAHLAVDEESGLVRQAEMTSANVSGRGSCRTIASSWRERARRCSGCSTTRKPSSKTTGRHPRSVDPKLHPPNVEHPANPPEPPILRSSRSSC
jgi:transposase, IS5 family